MPRDLIQAEIGGSTSAGRDFGKDPGMIVAVPSRGLMPYIIIPEGYYALVTTNGAEQNFSDNNKVWPSGYYSCAPWTRISHLVTKGNVLFDTPCKGCKTKDNVSVQIDVCVTFRIMGDASRNENPALVPIFVHEVTPSGLQQQLRDAIDESVRVLARSMKHTEVYGLRSITIMSDGTVVNADPDEGGGFENVMQNNTART
jgi:regulator of protease activity HflC (stomatin/prohibitin superfamily)